MRVVATRIPTFTGMEIEFKLSCTTDTAQALGRHLTRLTGAAPQRLQLQNTYYDTPNQDLRAQGIALRIRKQGRLKLQTVKCAGLVSGGLSSRPEWETPYGGRFDFSVISAAEVRHPLETLAHLPGFRATLDTDFSRHVWHWRPEAGTDIEVVIDRGRIVAGGREEAICEVELELISGEPNRLLDLVAHLGALVPLFPAPLSKATRGSHLLSGATRPITAPLAAPHAQTCSDAFNTLAQACLDHISIHLPANCARFSDHNLHQVRVGLRRLRALLQMFQPLLRQGWPCKAIAHGARQHMRMLARARELHVLQNNIVAPAANTLEPRAEEALRKHLGDMHKHAFAEAETHLLTQEFSAWLLHTSLALHARPLRRKAGAQTWRPQTLLMQPLAAYSKRLKRIKPTPDALHKLRKHGKHLRYQLAISALRPTAGKALAQLQDTLGKLNDLHGAADVFSRLPAAHADIIAAIGQYHAPRHTQLLLQAEAQLKRVRQEMRKRPSQSGKARA